MSAISFGQPGRIGPGLVKNKSKDKNKNENMSLRQIALISPPPHCTAKWNREFHHTCCMFLQLTQIGPTLRLAKKIGWLRFGFLLPVPIKGISALNRKSKQASNPASYLKAGWLSVAACPQKLWAY